MKTDSDKTVSPAGQGAQPEHEKEEFRPFKALHHLPRGKNAWNPSFMKKWWFWPACIGGLVLLKILASLVHSLVGE